MENHICAESEGDYVTRGHLFFPSRGQLFTIRTNYRSHYIMSCWENNDIEISLDEKKAYLIGHVSALVRQDKIGLGRIANTAGVKIFMCGSGCAINLDATPDYVVDEMYKFLVFKEY